MLHTLVDPGNPVVVIEHNREIIKTADWVVDLGPEGGDGGGKIVAQGTPEQVARAKKSYTGQYLKEYLARAKRAEAGGSVTPIRLEPGRPTVRAAKRKSAKPKVANNGRRKRKRA